ncbi:ABC transporter ATP-binding protein [Candidatus Uabimicrobium amorphum]|uniref:ABC transporter ATP-binding protein n=1 Tax=Uabimicrobium amorphum TaxID=2596890 RepID=A0A5S9IV35_UABAM|nr:ABC transporter ATP-binding protein [Candidatus Uabimicrobium amorphum]BBM87680.1 ABC transporter ATP-binding protein [Candidatus Uabimicrobium amorphum]
MQNKSLWRQILPFLAPYKKQFIALVIIIILVGAVDAIFPFLTKYVIDEFIVTKNFDEVYVFAIVYFAIIVMQTINIWLFISLAGKIETSVAHDVRRKSFSHLQNLSCSFYDRNSVGWLMARMTSDCERLGAIIAWGLVDIAWGLLTLVFVIIAMLILNVKLACIVLTVVPLLVVVSVFFQKLILRNYRGVRENNAQITAAFNEGIVGVHTTKTLVREEKNFEEFQKFTNKMYNSSFRASIYAAMFFPIVQIIAMAGCALAIYFGGNGVVAGAITYGTLVAFFSYVKLFFEPINHIARVFAEMQNARAAAEKIFNLLNTPVEITDDAAKGITGLKLRGEVQFCNTSFQYKQGEAVLQNFNLHVKPGQVIALVGETGSGKSTIVSLINRFYQPSQGEIRVDGENYQHYPVDWYRSQLGIVLQTPHLFSGTIAENIRYGKLDATQQEIEDAARLVYAHNFITDFPKGYETEVGEEGNLLSCGQKQLISFARAMITNPSIIIMDEATANIDTETEFYIQKAISRILSQRTCFIIAHRLSTIRSADRILVISKGQIVEDGSHHQLIEQQGFYYNLWNKNHHSLAI